MEIKVRKIGGQEQEYIEIGCHAEDARVKSIVRFVKGLDGSVSGSKGEHIYEIPVVDIFYIESVDKKTFVYTKQGCYDTKYRLYELEVMLGGYFMRCSKSMIINLKKVRNVKSQISGRIDATLLNDEVVVISRGYVKEVKRRLGIG